MGAQLGNMLTIVAKTWVLYSLHGLMLRYPTANYHLLFTNYLNSNVEVI